MWYVDRQSFEFPQLIRWLAVIEQIQIERLGADSYRVSAPTSISKRLSFSVSMSPDVAETNVPPVFMDRDSIEVSGLPAAPRHYFHVQLDEAPGGVVTHRHVALQGTPNFRDFGGYRTLEGRYVRWGRLYRSGVLSKLTEADQQALLELGIGLVCDFRGEDECQRDPSRWSPQASLRAERLPLSPGNQKNTLSRLIHGNDVSDIAVAHVVAGMEDINRAFVVDHCEVYSRLLNLILEVPAPVLIHCAAGKDRTGFGAAVILAALGVDRSQILHDYALTTRYLLPEVEMERLLRRYNLDLPGELVKPVVEARPQYLQAAFDTIDKTYGDFATYLREGLRIDRSAQSELKARLLTKI